mmetsp:Transcript_4955/g.13447  ORF Transcript_4955/g.13447 Transcript_4955/m.13447 type:complete len:242 (+) Transcript_4955:2160-2885(+)
MPLFVWVAAVCVRIVHVRHTRMRNAGTRDLATKQSLSRPTSATRVSCVNTRTAHCTYPLSSHWVAESTTASRDTGTSVADTRPATSLDPAMAWTNRPATVKERLTRQHGTKCICLICTCHSRPSLSVCTSTWSFLMIMSDGMCLRGGAVRRGRSLFGGLCLYEGVHFHGGLGADHARQRRIVVRLDAPAYGIVQAGHLLWCPRSPLWCRLWLRHRSSCRGRWRHHGHLLVVVVVVAGHIRH